MIALSKSKRSRSHASAFLTVACSLYAFGVLANAPYVIACVPGRQHTDDAYVVGIAHTEGSDLRGVSSLIEEYNPYYTGINPAGTNASLMINQAGFKKWAQLGWAKSKMDGSGTMSRRAWLQIYFGNGDNDWDMRFFGSKPIGNYTWYEIITDGNGKFDFYIDGNWKATYTRPVDPETYQFFGETHDFADQMPGEYSDKVAFENTGYFTTPNYTFHDATNLFTTDFPGVYGYNNNGTTHKIWDKCE